MSWTRPSWEPKCRSVLSDRSLLLLTFDSDGFEYPRAFVVRKQNVATAEELFGFIQARFAPHKWLTGGVYFVDSIPRTGSGKVIRRSLPSMEDKRRGKL